MGIIDLVLVGIIVLGIIIYLVNIYNGLVKMRRDIDKNWSNIDVLLKQRHDEIGKLIKVCEGYMKYERETLEKITAMRTQYLSTENVDEKKQIDNQITAALKTIFAVAENYPELKSNNNFVQLQNRISELENEISDRREMYNESVNIFNIRINQIPDMAVAKMMGYVEQKLFFVPEEERKDVEVKFEFPK